MHKACFDHRNKASLQIKALKRRLNLLSRKELPDPDKLKDILIGINDAMQEIIEALEGIG